MLLFSLELLNFWYHIVYEQTLNGMHSEFMYHLLFTVALNVSKAHELYV